MTCAQIWRRMRTALGGGRSAGDGLVVEVAAQGMAARESPARGGSPPGHRAVAECLRLPEEGDGIDLAGLAGGGEATPARRSGKSEVGNRPRVA